MKEIKIMVRADFAGDVALWIFIISYIYFSVYIFLIKSSLGPFLTTWVAFPRAGYGRERFLYLRIVRNVCRGFPLRIFPSLDAREPLSSFLFSFPIAVRPLLTLFVIFVFARLAASLATKTDDPIARDLLSRCLSRSLRASSASALCSRAGSLRRDSRTLLLRVRVPPSPLHRRRRARKSHAGGRVCATGPLTSYGHM